MKTLANLIATTFVLAIFGALLYAAYLGAVELWTVMSSLSFETRTVLLFVAAVVLLATIIVSASLRRASRTAMRGQASAERLAVYSGLLQTLMSVGQGTPISDGEPLQPQDFEGDLMLLAGGKVLKAYFALQETIEDGGAGPEEQTLALNRLVTTMRNDLGHSYEYADFAPWSQSSNDSSTRGHREVGLDEPSHTAA